MRYPIGFALVLALVGSPLGAGAQAEEEGATSEPNLQEPAPPSEAVPEEPALELKLDTTGVDVAPSPLRTPDGYTLKEMEPRVRRAKIGLGSSASAFFAGGMFLGFGMSGDCGLEFCFGGECTPQPRRCGAFVWTGTALLVGGLAGMIASSILLRRRKWDRDWLRAAHYGRPRRVQWDPARSRAVF